jgi:8-oxo-dGTP diphosphatase
MVRRKGTAESLTWQFPAGTINGGEEPALRAIEEVKEETGIVCQYDKRLGERHHPDTHVYAFYVACSYVSGEAKNRDQEENSEVRWVSASDVGDMVTTDLYVPIASFLKKLQKGRHSVR